MNRPTVNPVLSRELRERMRRGQAMVVLTVYLAGMAGVLWATYSSQTDTSTDVFSSLAATEIASIGRGIFEWVLFFMFLLVIFLVPGLTAGTISGERERQTLIPLQVTLLRPRSIVLGKLGSSIAFLCLLLVASAPILSISYLIGGVTIGQVLGALGSVLAIGVILASVTIAASTFVRRTQTATVVSYAVVLFMVLGTFLAYAVGAMLVEDPNDFDEERPSELILLTNPLVMISDIIGGTADPFVDTNSPFQPIRNLVNQDDFSGDSVQFAPVGRAIEPGFFVEDGFGVPEGFDFQQVDDTRWPFWSQSLITLSTIASLCLLGAVRRLRTPARVER